MNGNVVLIGMMGCGKTTVGGLLAQQLGFTFVDTDQYIEGALGRSIPDIFAREGEDFFRSWVRREARGKRTGAGITGQLRTETAMEPGERFGYVETFPGYVAGVSAMEEGPERAERYSVTALLTAAEQGS